LVFWKVAFSKAGGPRNSHASHHGMHHIRGLTVEQDQQMQEILFADLDAEESVGDPFEMFFFKKKN
jgi:hypothetical protein